MPDKELTQETILRECPRMGLGDRFVFECGKRMDCFTRCCADVSIVLTPYDVLRLRRAVGLDSSEFLRRYTISPFDKEQKIPAVLLKMDQESRACPFVTFAGCRVYADRPWACRMYPLGLAEPRNATPDDSKFHFLIHEDFCHGHGQGSELSVRDWLASQGIDECDAGNASFTAFMLDAAWDKAGELTPAQMDMYYMGCYDLDSFRRFVFESRFLQLYEVDEARVEAMRTDDEELLEFAVMWLRWALFRQPTVKIKPSVLADAKQRLAQAKTHEVR